MTSQKNNEAELTQHDVEVASTTEGIGSEQIGAQAVESVITAHQRMSRLIASGPQRTIKSPMILNPDLITM